MNTNQLTGVEALLLELTRDPNLRDREEEIRRRIPVLLAERPLKQRRAIELRFGINCEPHSPAEIAKIFQVSRSQPGLIIRKALWRMQQTLHRHAETPPKNPSEWLTRTVYEGSWAVLASHALHNANIATIGALTEHTAGELLKVRGFYKKYLQQVREGLHTMGLHLKGE